MFTNNKAVAWAKRHKVWSSIIAFFVITFIFGSLLPEPEKKTDIQQATKPQPAQQTQKPTEQPKQPTITTPKYEVVTEFGNNKSNKSVLVSAADATDEKLTLLGKELNSKYGSPSIVRIGIFTDKHYAEVFADFNAIGNLSDTEAKAYDQAYVGQLNINKNSGLKEFVIRPSRDAKTIKL